jgi:hypothetical protein
MKNKITAMMVALVAITLLFPALAFSQEIPREKPGACWVNFKEGSWAKYKVMGEMVQKKTLKSKTADAVVLITETEIPGMPPSSEEEHLSLKPKEEEGQFTVIKTYEEEITLAGKKFKCKVIEYKGVEEEKKYTSKVWLSDDVPYFMFERGIVKATQQDEGEKEEEVVLEYAGEKEVSIGDKKVKYTIFKAENDEEGELLVSNEVPGMLVKMGDILELIDFEIK